jgi:hypothetical protein
MVFVFRVEVVCFCFFFFFFFIDNLELNDMTFILGVDMNVCLLIETHMTYYKPFILTKK